MSQRREDPAWQTMAALTTGRDPRTLKAGAARMPVVLDELP